MRKRIAPAALAAAFIAGSSLVAFAQMSTENPGSGGSAASRQLGPSRITTGEAGTTVFHGDGEAPGPAGSATVFHGAPAGGIVEGYGSSAAPGPAPSKSGR
jgi:hypothetical protein